MTTIAKDSETTGVDGFHGASPFFFTTCNEEGVQAWWEADVCPLTRTPRWSEEDLIEMAELFNSHETWIYQNSKFDMAAELAAKVDHPADAWERVEDTLVAAHVLGSNQPKDLTSLALIWLDEDIKPLEDRLEKAVKECRGLVQRAQHRLVKQDENSPLANWRIAEAGLPEMPSAKEKTWKYDCWLPRAMAKHKKLPEPKEDCDHVWREWSCLRCRGHRFWVVCREYANQDSAVTLPIWLAMERALRDADLWEIYKARLRSMELAWRLERDGVTLNRTRLGEVRDRCREESDEKAAVCVGIAEGMGHSLTLPKAGRNKSLDSFAFDVLKLPQVSNPKAKTDRPSFDAQVAIPYWLSVLEHGTKARSFITALLEMRSKDTTLQYLEGYERYWLPLLTEEDREIAWNLGAPLDADVDEWYILHPHLNPVGTSHLRWSSSQPNSQNISTKETECPECDGDGCEECGGSGRAFRSIRYCFGPAPGREWWSLDAKNIELRIPAFESGEREVIELFERPDDPPYFGSQHFLNFSTVYPDLWADALKRAGPEKAANWLKKHMLPWYKRCKNGDFAIQYGAGKRTADRTFGRAGAYELIQGRFGKLAALNRKWVDHANKHGYVETLPDRTVNPRRGYPLIVRRGDSGGVLETTPLNYHVSGSAMWWTMRAMGKVQDRLDIWRQERDSFNAWMTLQVHDELVLDLPKRGDPKKEPKTSNLSRVRVLQKLMESCGDDIGIKTPVGLEYHPISWDQGQTF